MRVLRTNTGLHGGAAPGFEFDTPAAPCGASSRAASDEDAPYSVLDQLIATILSQNTTDANSWPAFLRLKAAFPTWEAARVAPADAVAACIKSAGLSAIKTARIQTILHALHAERGACCLEHLHAASDADAKAALTRFKGVGPKTVACVLMFALRRAEFPVDTHVWKLAKALAWVPQSADREATYAHLNARVPGALKHALHVLLVAHGKVYKNEPGPLRAALRAAGGAEAGGEMSEHMN
jgi:endonuclease-3